MSAIDDYWQTQGRALREEFERIRRTHSDSDTKGGANEESVADLLEANFHPRPVATNSAIIDSEGRQSGEIDVLLCNEYQPFLARQRAELLIAEEVDVAVQVKAILSTQEIDRMLENCRTVKQLRRRSISGDVISADPHDIP